MAREQPAILDPQTRIVDCLSNGNPALLPGRRDNEKGAQPQPERDGNGRAQHRRPRFREQRDAERDPGQQVGEHHSQGRVGQPGAGDHQGQRQSRPIQCAPDQLNFCCGISSVRIAQDEEQQDRSPEAPGQFGIRGTFVGGKQCVAGEDSSAAGQGGDASVEFLASQSPRPEPRRGQQKEGHCLGNKTPRQHYAKEGSKHPGQGRIKDESRLTRPIVGARCPVRIENAEPPAVKSVEPGNKVEIEIVAAGNAAPQLRRRREGRAQQEDGRPRHPPPDRSLTRKSWSLIPDPCSLSSHGSRRKVC